MVCLMLGVVPPPCVPPAALLWYEQWLPSYPHCSASRALLRVWDYSRSGVLGWSVLLVSFTFLYYSPLFAVSLDNLVAPLICIISGFLQQQFGPLRILMISCVPYTAGWVSAAMATSAHHLYISR